MNIITTALNLGIRFWPVLAASMAAFYIWWLHSTIEDQNASLAALQRDLEASQNRIRFQELIIDSLSEIEQETEKRTSNLNTIRESVHEATPGAVPDDIQSVIRGLRGLSTP